MMRKRVDREERTHSVKIDPVCRMRVEETEALSAEFDGELYYFCSEGCRKRFRESYPLSPHRSRYELIIVGGGPAGLTAAVYAATMKLDAFVLTKDLGGQAIDSTKIENYMGYDFITGPELIAKFKDHLIHTQYIDHLMSEVERIESVEGGFAVTTSDLHTYHAKAVIIATGMTRRKLQIPGEERFQRKGVFYGNVQDYSFVQGRNVAVIGGGNSALQMVDNLHTVADTIYLVSEYELTADRPIIDRVSRFPNLQTIENAKVLSFSGKESLSGITIRKKEEQKTVEIPVQGVFIAIGLQPNSSLVSSLVKLNDRREIVIGHDCSTSHPGIFAAGDVTSTFGKRIIIASGEGAKVALAARQYILDLRKEK